MADSYDVIVIGSGPGGYVAAIRAAQLGQRTAVIEKDVVGGRCLNYACIPAKTILHTAEVYDAALNSADLGVTVDGAKLDWSAVDKRREKVRKTLTGGVSMLFDKNNAEQVARAKACYRALVRESIRQGMPPYRIGIDYMDEIQQSNGSAYGATLARIKDVLDPHGVVAPGRYLSNHDEQRRVA